MTNMKLKMDFAVIERALNANKNSQEELKRQLSDIDSSIGSLGQSFKGKAGSSFVKWWEGSGKSHGLNLVSQLERLDDTLLKLRRKVEDTDIQSATFFKKS